MTALKRSAAAKNNAYESRDAFSIAPKALSILARFRVQGSGFRVQGSGFRVQGSEFRVQSSEFKVQGSGFRVQALACESPAA
jgi:plasmid replication initiation protein